MSFARHNPTASEGIAEAKAAASELIMERIQPLVDKGLFAEGMSGAAFARIWYALFFGQIALEGEHALSINDDDWLRALYLLADAAIKPEYSDLAR